MFQLNWKYIDVVLYQVIIQRVNINGRLEFPNAYLDTDFPKACNAHKKFIVDI